MMFRNCLLGLFVALSACAVTDSRKVPPAGLVEADPGGAAGFQHGIERSRFVLGANARSINEFGFSKLVGSEGTFAVSNANGAVVALQHARSAEQQKQVWYSGGHEEHSKAVLAYFIEAGIPRDQIASIDALTSASISGATDGGPTRAESRIRGWQSVLRRSISGVPIIDSVAWARLNDDGKVLAEWVYWPAIPGKVIDDAKRFRARLSENSERVRFSHEVTERSSAGAGSNTPLVSAAKRDVRSCCELRCYRVKRLTGIRGYIHYCHHSGHFDRPAFRF